MDVLDSTVDVSTGVEKMLAPVDLPACTVLRRGFSSTRAGETTKEVLHSFRRRARAISHFDDSYDDMNFTPPLLAMIQTRTLVVQGDRDPLYPVELSIKMAKFIPMPAFVPSPTLDTTRSSARKGRIPSRPRPRFESDKEVARHRDSIFLSRALSVACSENASQRARPSFTIRSVGTVLERAAAIVRRMFDPRAASPPQDAQPITRWPRIISKFA